MVLSGPLLVAGVVATLALLGLSAFFSGSEIAIFSLERHRLNALVDRDVPGVATLVRLRESPHRLLVTVLVGNNIANIAMTSLATAILADRYGPGVALAGATVLMSVLVLVFGEIAPKSYGVANAERVSVRVAGALTVVQRALSPLVFFFESVSRLVNHLTGGDLDIERPFVTRDDIDALLRTGRAHGIIDEDEHEMVRGVFELSTTRAREVMVPRVNIVAVEAETPLSEIIDVAATERLTRVPVYRGTLDHVVGIADIRDLERAVREDLALEDVLLDTIQVPDTREIDDLLAEMQSERVPMVIVRDEFGEMEGLITIEDILEEIVGEIFETGEERHVRWRDGDLLVNGEVTVSEVNEILDVDLPREGEYETVAGLINSVLGRIGDVGDVVERAGVSLTVEAIEGNRITNVCIRRLTERDADADEDCLDLESDAGDSSEAKEGSGDEERRETEESGGGEEGREAEESGGGEEGREAEESGGGEEGREAEESGGGEEGREAEESGGGEEGREAEEGSGGEEGRGGGAGVYAGESGEGDATGAAGTDGEVDSSGDRPGEESRESSE